MGQHLEAFGRRFDCHAMAHPCALLGGGAVKQSFGLVDDGLGLAVLAEGGLVDVSAQCIRHGLESVADAKHWNARVE